MTQAVELPERAVVAAEKLANEVARPRLDAVKLHGRIEPFDGARSRPYPENISQTLPDMIDAISKASAYIVALQQDIGRIRGVIDGICADAVSRKDMKPFLRGCQ